MAKILYGRKADDEEWQETIITEVEERIPAATEWAKANGYTVLRIAEIDLDKPPEFGRNLIAKSDKRKRIK